MPRRASSKGLTIAELEQELKAKRSQIAKLEKQRAKAARKLHAIEEKIVSLGGSISGRGTSAGGRVRNSMGLPDMIVNTLSKGAKPMRVGDIVDAVLSAGYNTNSANFRGIVNQTLIKDKRFTSPERGLYQLKK